MAEKLFQIKNGGKAFDEAETLLRQCKRGSRTARGTLIRYMLEGKVDHVRDFVAAELAEGVEEGDRELATAFRKGITDNAIRYWSVLGFVHAAGRNAYEDVVAIALDSSMETGIRAQSIQCLARHSGQTFDRGLDKDPECWSIDELRIDEVSAWKQAGFPRGDGRAKPKRHPANDRTKTEFEKVVARFDRRLAQLRKASQDAANPTHWLSPADSRDIAAVTTRWNLPKQYLDFLTRFSPQRVIVPEDDIDFASLIELFGADELIDGQAGYAVHPDTHKPLKGWPRDHVVIASSDGDPFVLDLSGGSNKDAPVAMAAHGQGTWEFSEVASSFQGFIELLSEPGVLFADLDPEHGIKSLNKAIRKNPDGAELYLKRGQCLINMEEYAGARRDFDEAIKRGAKNRSAFEGRANAAFGLGRWKAAITDYGRAIQLRATPEAYVNRGQAHYYEDRDREAMGDFSQAIELAPTDAEAWYWRGRSYWSLQEISRAEADLTRAIKLSEGNEEWLEDCYLARGGLRCNAERFNDAVKDLNECLKLNPENSRGWLFRGNTYCGMKKYAKALADYEQALELDPDDPSVMSTVGFFLATCARDSLRDGKRAFALAKRAVKLTKNEHLDSLAATLAEIGKFSEAVKSQQQAIRHCDDPQELKKLKLQLAAYKKDQPYRE